MNTDTEFSLVHQRLAQEHDRYWNPFLGGYIRSFPKQSKTENYFAGNSLGGQAAGFVKKLLYHADIWIKKRHHGHFHTDGTVKDRPWWRYQEKLVPTASRLLGVRNMPDCPEVAIFGTLSPNTRALLETFCMYIRDELQGKGTPTIVTIKVNFPSDDVGLKYALRVVFGNKFKLIEVEPDKNGLYDFRRMINIIKTTPNVKLGFFPGLCYITGQRFPLEELSDALHSRGAIAGFDLAHSIGNYQLSLHHDGVDFATFCGYKYLCGGPGAVGGIFVHQDWLEILPVSYRVSGWFGIHMDDRFNFDPGDYRAAPGAWSFLQSNDQIFNMLGVESFFDLVDEYGEEHIFRKHQEISTFMYECLKQVRGIRIVTPEPWTERGCQILFKPIGKNVDEVLEGVNATNFCEKRGDGIRVAPVAYNTFEECWEFARDLDRVLNE
jgi:kynureninase